jgi:hypothetical protein
MASIFRMKDPECPRTDVWEAHNALIIKVDDLESSRTDISEENIASIFRVEDTSPQEPKVRRTYHLHFQSESLSPVTDVSEEHIDPSSGW